MGEESRRRRSQSARSDCGSCAEALSEREREMAKKTASRRGAVIVALIAVLAALAGPGAASATQVKPTYAAPAPITVVYGWSTVASWVEEASWAES